MGYEDYESDYLEYRQKVDKVYIQKNDERRVFDNKLSELARKQLELHNEIKKLENEREKLLLEDSKVERDFWNIILSLKEDFNSKHKDERMFVSIKDFKKTLSEMLDLDVNVSVSFQDDIFIYDLTDDVCEIAEKYCKDFNSSHKFQYRLDEPIFNLKVDFDMSNVGFLNIFPVSLMDVQADGKSLLGHCSSEVYYDSDIRRNKSVIVIDKDIDNILFSFSYKDLASNFSDRSFFISSIDERLLKEAFLKTFNNGKVKKKI